MLNSAVALFRQDLTREAFHFSARLRGTFFLAKAVSFNLWFLLHISMKKKGVTVFPRSTMVLRFYAASLLLRSSLSVSFAVVFDDVNDRFTAEALEAAASSTAPVDSYSHS